MTPEDAAAAANALSGSSRHYVYRISNAIELVYVGCTNDVERRLAEHRRNSAWWALGETVSITEYPSAADALLAEREAIRTEDPIGNSVHYAKATSTEAAMETQAAVSLAMRTMFGSLAARDGEAQA